MNTQQPKYITYKGVKYERVNTLNEIIVEPGSKCCVITVRIARGHYTVNKEYKIGNPGRIADDTLSKVKQKQYDGLDPNEYETEAEYIEEFFSKKPIEIDRYSYYADLGEEEFLAVCTKGKGKWSFLYDLAKNNDDDGIIDAADEILHHSIYTVREDLAPRYFD